MPVGLAVAGANCVDFKLARQTIDSVPVERPEPKKSGPQGMCLDRGYDYLEVWELLEEFGFTAHVAIRGGGDAADSQPVKQREARHKARRWVVERTHSWMNRFRGILVRWNKKPENYLAMLHLVCAVITYRCAGLFG